MLTYQKISDLEGGLQYPIGETERADFGESLAALGDLDGDGVTDIAIGVEDLDDGATSRGAMFILFLNPDGTVKAEQKISQTSGGFTGDLSNTTHFAENLGGNVGDINGDGYPDVVAGVPSDDDGGSNRGAIWVLFLNPDGTVKGHQKISSTRGGLSSAFSSPLSNGDGFGSGLIGLGHFDSDNVPDLAIGAWRDDFSTGALFLLYMNSNGTVKSYTRIRPRGMSVFSGKISVGDGFGQDVANLGDVDGDGVIDLAVGSQRVDDGGPERGGVWIMFMRADGSVKAVQKISDTHGNFDAPLKDDDEFGQSVAGIGDLDKDGIPDLAVGAEFDKDGGFKRGAVYLLYLNSNGTVREWEKISDTQGNFTAPMHDNDNLGQKLAPLGDLNLDGTLDIVATADGDRDGGRETGAAYVLFLRAPNAPPPTGSDLPVLSLRADDLFQANGASIPQWPDTSGYNNTALCAQQCPAMSQASVGGRNALLFDGNNDAMTITSSDTVNSASSYTAKTMYLVFQTGSNVTSRQMIYEQGGFQRGINAYVEGGVLRLGAWNVAADSADTPWGPVFLSAPVAPNTRYLATLIHSQSSIRGYLNGTLIGQSTATGTLFTHGAGIGIGAVVDKTRLHNGGNGGDLQSHFAGRIAELRFFNQAHDAAQQGDVETELTDYYAIGQVLPPVDPPVEPVDPIARFRADDIVQADGSDVTQWLDSTSNGHSATCVGDCPVLQQSAIDVRSAVAFDGDSALRVADSALINLPEFSQPFTEKSFVMVIRTGADVSSRQVLFEQGATTRGANLYIDDGAVHLGAWNLTDNSANTPWGPAFVDAAVQPNTDYLVTLVYSTNGVVGYLDGAEIGRIDDLGELYRHGGGIGIGAQVDRATYADTLDDGALANWFDGHVAELLLYNEALSDGQRGAIEGELIEYYGLD